MASYQCSIFIIFFFYKFLRQSVYEAFYLLTSRLLRPVWNQIIPSFAENQVIINLYFFTVFLFLFIFTSLSLPLTLPLILSIHPFPFSFPFALLFNICQSGYPPSPVWTLGVISSVQSPLGHLLLLLETIYPVVKTEPIQLFFQVIHFY